MRSAARHNLVEIAEACRRESNLFKLDGQDPASVQPVEAVRSGFAAFVGEMLGESTVGG